MLPSGTRRLSLGSPVHAAQVFEDERTGRSTLHLVTRPVGQPVVHTTAVDDQEGAVRWQRQIGLVPQGSPLILKNPDDEPFLLVQDQGSSLYLLPPENHASDVPLWQAGAA